MASWISSGDASRTENLIPQLRFLTEHIFSPMNNRLSSVDNLEPHQKCRSSLRLLPHNEGHQFNARSASTQPQMDRGLHRGRLALRGGRHRSVLTARGRLVDERRHDRTAHHRRFGEGDLPTGQARSLLHHSDRGSQYSSEQFQRLMADHGVVCSMSRSGNVWDNAAMDSFFSSLKTERTARKLYRTRDEARADVFDYIERFYNSKRRHSTIGYISPVEFERQWD
jgi:putative transposase